MQFEEVQKQLSGKIDTLQKKLVESKLTASETRSISQELNNYQYILEMAEMNNFHRGIKH